MSSIVEGFTSLFGGGGPPTPEQAPTAPNPTNSASQLADSEKEEDETMGKGEAANILTPQGAGTSLAPQTSRAVLLGK